MFKTKMAVGLMAFQVGLISGIVLCNILPLLEDSPSGAGVEISDRALTEDEIKDDFQSLVLSESPTITGGVGSVCAVYHTDGLACVADENGNYTGERVRVGH